MPNPQERVLIVDALEFIRARTGFEFERRTFTRWVESGEIEIDGRKLAIATNKVGGRYFIARASLDLFVLFLTAAGEE
jgi:hypothetical protein